MKIKTIALIEPAVASECLTTEIFAQIRAALPFLAGALKAGGYGCRVYCEELVRLEPRIEHIASSFDAFGISTTINTVMRAMEIARVIKRFAPEKPVIFGGALAGSFDEALLEAGDYCIDGRAETTLPALLEALSGAGPLEKVPRLSFKRGGLIIRTDGGHPTADFASDFGAVENFGGPSERRNRFGFRKPPLYSVFASTGCVRNCRFCVTEKRFLKRSANDFIEDFKSVLALHRGFFPPRFMLVDDCAFGDAGHLLEILDRLAALRAERNFSLMMQFHVKPLIKDPDIAGLMKKAGVSTLLMGFESASDASLASENKGTRVADNLEAIGICRRRGIVPYGYFVAGFDSDDADGVRKIFDFICDNRLTGQVLPVGVMEAPGRGGRTLDPYSFGAAMKVSHIPKNMKPHELQKTLIDGYDRIYSLKRLPSMGAREAVYGFFFSICYRAWRPGLLAHLNYLELLDRFRPAL